MRPSILVLSLTLVAVLALQPATHAGNTGLIQPGVDVDESCTLNFVYDGVEHLEGRVYIGVAAHCYETLGTVVSTADHPDFGELAFIGDDSQTATDYAFIEVYPAFHEFVSAQVKGHAGAPSLVATPDATVRGDTIRFSGSGVVFELTEQTQEERFGILWTHTTEEWLAYGPVTPGDSGGPVIHDSGAALGIVTQLTTSAACCDDPTAVVGAQGPSVQGLLDKAAASGFPVTLRTV